MRNNKKKEEEMTDEELEEYLNGGISDEQYKRKILVKTIIQLLLVPLVAFILLFLFKLI